ncbi:hypothetical protein F5Y03DRAFT_395807 [Xylaria venustula]|nr:hypothetical protein F5Y03DRAFT_395807 [Xylaria venustula]
MAIDIYLESHGSGLQNIVAGPVSQSNLHGAGTQNNYYGYFQDPNTTETKKLHEEKEEDAHPNTCEWLFSTTELQEWRDRQYLSTQNGVLWIKGKPGAGKSTLIYHALSYFERLFADNIIVAYFFNTRGAILEKTPLGMMRYNVYQLLNQNDALYRRFVGLYRENQRICYRKYLQWEQQELRKFVQSTIKQQLQPRPLLLLVDALEECDEKEVRYVVAFLEILSVDAVANGVKLRIRLSSRHYPRISMRANLELVMEPQCEHGNDIATYVEDKLLTDNKSIKTQVQDKADGVFFDAENSGRSAKTPGRIFEKLIANGGSNNAELVRFLQWVLLSRRALTPEELYIEAVTESLPSYQAIRRRIISSSKGLVQVRQETTGEEFVQFIHQSVNDFLYRNKEAGKIRPNYAVKGMLYHADKALLNGTMGLESDNHIERWLAARYSWVGWLPLVNSYYITDMNFTFGGPGTLFDCCDAGLLYALGAASYRNLSVIVVAKGVNIYEVARHDGTVLEIASALGSLDYVKFLLEQGADPNTQAAIRAER